MNFRKIFRIHLKIIFVSLVVLFYSKFTFAELQPNKTQNVKGINRPIDIEVAASIYDNAQLEHGIYLFKVHCALDSCSLERLSLNECVHDKEGKSSFKPSVYTWASWAGFLEASFSNNVLELVVFQGTHHQLPAKMILNLDFSNTHSVQLKSFNATGFIDFRKWPDTDTRIEYVPLQGDPFKQLDCPVFLPGISLTNPPGRKAETGP
jgi:uncharacterized protein YjbI with pentapeptide repeats